MFAGPNQEMMQFRCLQPSCTSEMPVSANDMPTRAKDSWLHCQLMQAVTGSVQQPCEQTSPNELAIMSATRGFIASATVLGRTDCVSVLFGKQHAVIFRQFVPHAHVATFSLSQV